MTGVMIALLTMSSIMLIFFFFYFVFLILVTISANGTIQLATPGSEGLQGLQTVTTGGAQQSTTVLQYAQTPDGQQILVPSNQVVVQGQSTRKCSVGQKKKEEKMS